jgi:agmatinase
MGLPAFAVPASFLGIASRDTHAPVAIAGIPFDIGTTNRSGARFGPHAIRHASRMLTDGAHPKSWVDPTTRAISDVGDFEIALGDISKTLALIETQAAPYAHLITLGGEHGITLPLLRALAKKNLTPPALIHFDAHVDTWPDSSGQEFGHGQPFYHAIRENLIDPSRSVQIGIRSPVQREVWDWTLEQGLTIITAEEFHDIGVAATAARIHTCVGAAPAYLSFDIDCLDPAFAPGTGTPEIGGLASWQAQAIFRRLSGIDFVGMDLVEVAPAYDVSEITSLAGATLVWEYLALLVQQNKI